MHSSSNSLRAARAIRCPPGAIQSAGWVAGAITCGARWNDIARASGGGMQVVDDKFEATSGGAPIGKPAPFENVYGILPGSDPALAKIIFIVSGHMDSRATDVMDPNVDAPGADDDSFGCCCEHGVRASSRRSGQSQTARGPGVSGQFFFSPFPGEEQGLIGAEQHAHVWVKQQGYTVGGMLDNDIVGADSAPAPPHRVRLFSGNGDQDDADSPSREMARAIEEIDGRDADPE